MTFRSAEFNTVLLFTAANNINSPYSFWSLTRINEEKDTETNV